MDLKINCIGRIALIKSKIGTAIQDFLLNQSGKLTQKLIHFFGDYLYIIKMDVTEACNINCKMCYASKNYTVPKEKILSILDQIKNVPLRLDLLGGEPLLRKDLATIIAYAKQQAKIKEITLYTNGTLVTEKIANELHAAGLDNAIVSLISHDPKIHDSFVGMDGAWQKTASGIKNFAAAGVKTYTFTAMHTENIETIDQIYQFVTEQLKVSPLFYQYIPQRINDPLLPSKKQWHECKHKILYQLSKKHTEFFKKVVRCCQTACLGGKYALSIKTNGDVTPCPFIHDLVLGNVYQQNIWDIFAQRYKTTHFHEFTTLDASCLSCTYKKLCGGGCRAGNKLIANNYLGKDCRCMGPYHDRISDDKIADRMPTFF